MPTSAGKRDAALAGAGENATGVGHGQAADLLERISDAFIALDREWRITYMNRAAMAMGRPRSPTAIGRSHWEEWPETLGTELERQYRLAMASQQPVHFEQHYQLPGLDFWHSVHAYPDANGLSIFFRDITEQKRATELAMLLANASSRFVATLDQSAILRVVAEMALPLLGDWACVYLVDEAFNVIAVDSAAVSERRLSMLRQVVAQLPVSATDTRLPFNRSMQQRQPIVLAPLDDAFYQALGSPELRDFVAALGPDSLLCVPLVARNRTIGGITYGLSQGRRRHDDHDVMAAREVALPAGLALDTARVYESQRRASAAAEDARRRAEEANISKVEFLRAMSHEMRTPLNAIGGYLQLLQMGVHGELSPDQLRDIQRIERNQMHVTRLISDVLNFTRLEAGRLEFEFERVLIAPLLGNLGDYVAPLLAGDHALHIRDCEPGIAVWADADKATQILVNLISNALKHTPKGTCVEVVCEQPAGAPASRVHISVRDNGPGIAADKLESIFQPFVQIGKSLRNPVEGLGLGLAIARDLARAMHGDLVVQSALGQGTTFTLALPRG